MALFGGKKPNLIEFRAGKMFMKGKMCHPDKRKGLIYIHRTDDGLTHFCWKDRGTNRTEDDLVIFPNDTEFKRVSECTTGRVYVLKFKASTKKHIFWLQEPSDARDEAHCHRVNDLLNTPDSPDGASMGSSLFSSALGLDANILGLAQQLGLGNVNPAQLLSLLGAGPPEPGMADSDEVPGIATQSGPIAQPPSILAKPGKLDASAKDKGKTKKISIQEPKNTIQLGDFQNILASINVPGGSAPREAINLAKALTPDALNPLLNNPENQKRLKPFLPEVEGGAEDELKATVKSPHFRHALSSFSEALQSGQLGPLVQQFGLGAEATKAAENGDLEAFAKALENQKR